MNTDPTLLKQCAEKGAEAALAKEIEVYPTPVGLMNLAHPNERDQALREAFAQAAIEHYLAANPMWVLASERVPTREDADGAGDVAVFCHQRGFVALDFADVAPSELWTSIKNIPKPAPKYDSEFEAWYAGKPGDKDLLYSAWKAGRNL